MPPDAPSLMVWDAWLTFSGPLELPLLLPRAPSVAIIPTLGHLEVQGLKRETSTP